MHKISMYLIMNGLLMILPLGFSMLGSKILFETEFLVFGLIFQLLANVFIISYFSIKGGGLYKFFANDIDTSFSVHPVFIILIGMIFVIAGFVVAMNIEPTQSEKSLNSTQIVVTGGIFILMGTGISLSAFTKWAQTLSK